MRLAELLQNSSGAHDGMGAGPGQLLTDLSCLDSTAALNKDIMADTDQSYRLGNESGDAQALIIIKRRK